MQGMHEDFVEEKYYLLFICSAYNVICKNYEDLLSWHDNLGAILKAQHYLEGQAHRCRNYFLIGIFHDEVTIPIPRRWHIQDLYYDPMCSKCEPSL